MEKKVYVTSFWLGLGFGAKTRDCAAFFVRTLERSFWTRNQSIEDLGSSWLL